MPTTRRDFLRQGLQGATLLACGTSVPGFLARSARALATADPKGRILVVIQLDGGNDGLNTVVPHADDVYHASRPKLRIEPKNLKTIDDHTGLHPALGGFAKKLEAGRLAIVQSVGYPNPDRSHFGSMAVWHTARRDAGDGDPGWLARAIDATDDRSGGDAPALHIADDALPQALHGSQRYVPSLDRPEQFRRRLGLSDAVDATAQRAALDRIAALNVDPTNPLLDFVGRSTLVSYASSARIEAALSAPDAAGGYPDSNGLARRLRLIARLIRSGLTTPIYYAHLDGFDTHADQLGRHENLLGELDRELGAFLDDLDRSGEADRVAVLVFSEFGRRLRENASAGTDHGTAAPLFLLGSSVAAGLHGPRPDLTNLDADGDPRHAIDFRCVYASILEQWLGTPPADVLGGAFEPLPLFRV